MNEDILSTFSSDIVSRLEALGIKKATAVQAQVIPKIREGKNVIFQSETGTGKTFAFLLPLIEKIEENRVIFSASNGDNNYIEENNDFSEKVSNLPKIVIIAPTLELAAQIKTATQQISSVKTVLFAGNAPLRRQIEMLKEKPKIIIGTAGRILELIKLQKLKTHKLVACVFDEADRLVKKEMRDDTWELAKKFPQQIQKISCSATINDAVKKLVENADYIELPPEDVLRKRITHIAIFAEPRKKIDVLCKFLRTVQSEKLIIFASTQEQVRNIAERLWFRKIECDALFSKQDKFDRKAALDNFRQGKTRTLITSDLAARGLDIPGITHVVQMDFPPEKDFFIHRAGRTARAGECGTNVVIGDEFEMRKYAAVEKQIGITVYPKVLYGGKLLAPDEVVYE